MTEQVVAKSDLCEPVSHHWAVVLAGGDGRRLLPLTRRLSGDERPKQFCRVLRDETLLDQTLDRVARIINPYRTLSIVTKAHEEFYRDHKTGSRGARFLVQPLNRGTCPAIVYSLVRLHEMDPNAFVAFFPSDHHFADDQAFTDCVRRAFISAEAYSDSVILLGVAPNQPETEYGWIEPGEPLMASAPGLLFGVRRFWEKPSSAIAIELMRRGCFWNSFIMVGRVASFLSLVGRAVPDVLRSFQAIAPTFFTAREEASVFDLYQRVASSSFAADVLSVSPGQLAVFCSKTLEWADVGDVGRAVSVIASFGDSPTHRKAPASQPRIMWAAPAAG